MKSFYHLLANSMVVGITNFFVWGTVVYWAYLETRSVLATSIIAGIYLVVTASSGIWLGSLVDHHKKKTVIITSSVGTLVFFLCGLGIYMSAPADAFTTISTPWFWALVISLLLGVICGNLRSIAMPVAVTLLVPEEKRPQANGLLGTVFGISFAVSNVAAGLALGFFGMWWVIVSACIVIIMSLAHIVSIPIAEPRIAHLHEDPGAPKGAIDLRGTIAAVRSVSGLFPLIFFTTFNNFLGGVFMALMDAYGLSLVSVQVWGTLWGVLSLGFILGGLYIAKWGLGKNPVLTIFRVNTFTWALCIIMTLQPSIVLLGTVMLLYLCAAPFIEAAEQTVIQKVVPVERQGRVFGFAQSVEQSAAPLTAFVIGPIAQFVFIPFMTTGAGVELIGSWYGVGEGRGIGLVFVCAGIIGLLVTRIARHSRSVRRLSAAYREHSA